jgi:hypothetical protein
MPDVAVKSPTVKLDDTAELLTKLQAGIDQTGDAELAARFDRMEEQIKSAEKIADKQKRDLALEVIKADMDSLLATSAKEEADLAHTVNQLDMLAEQFGSDFEKLQQLNEAEQKLISDKEEELEAAKKAWFNPEAKIARAETLLAEAKIEAARQMRQRLMNAKFEESTQVFKRRAQETIVILGKRKERLAVQLANVRARKAAAFDIYEQAAKAVTTLEEKAAIASGDLSNAELELRGLESGTQAYAAQEKKVSMFKEQLIKLEGEINVATSIRQSKQRFSTSLGVHEVTQLKLQANIATWIATLKADMEERVVEIESRLETMRGMSDQDIASHVDKIGAKLDQDNAEYMAKAGRVSDQLMLERMESQPERMRKLGEVVAAQAKAHLDATNRLNALREESMRRYGIDPMEGSFLPSNNPAGSQPAA